MRENAQFLIIEEHSSITNIIKSILNQLGYKRIIETNNSEAAMDYIKSNKIDIILSAWALKPETGLDVLKKVRANEETANIPFLIITLEASLNKVKAAKDAGVSSYIVKPFSANTLKKKIDLISRKIT